MNLRYVADNACLSSCQNFQAERCRISVGHSDELTSDPDIISALRYRSLIYHFSPFI